MPHSVLMHSEFRGVDANDPFVRAALAQAPVVTKLGPIAWPDGLKPAAVPLGGYTPGVAQLSRQGIGDRRRTYVR